MAPYDNRIHEESDQRLRLTMLPASDRGTDHNVLGVAQSVDKKREHRLKEHERRNVVLFAELPDAGRKPGAERLDMGPAREVLL
ncbi:hypothetical protein D3C71_782240 [compost metagenome]